MYRCESCGDVSGPGDRAFLVVTETRDVEYEDSFGIVVGRGTETVKTETTCDPCAHAAHEEGLFVHNFVVDGVRVT